MNTLQMIALVQCYIHHFKDVEVNIAQPRAGRDYFLLSKMSEKALKYIK